MRQVEHSPVQDVKGVAALASDIKMLLGGRDQRDTEWQRNLVQALRTLRPDDFRRAIRAQLRFGGVGDRIFAVPKAWQKTYGWVFQPPKDSYWANFIDWLTTN
jgi:hypothetical protein